MLIARTVEQKKALAKALGAHDTAFLIDLAMLGERFGPFEAVAYEAQDFDQHRQVVSAALRELQE